MSILRFLLDKQQDFYLLRVHLPGQPALHFEPTDPDVREVESIRGHRSDPIRQRKRQLPEPRLQAVLPVPTRPGRVLRQQSPGLCHRSDQKHPTVAQLCEVYVLSGQLEANCDDGPKVRRNPIHELDSNQGMH